MKKLSPAQRELIELMRKKPSDYNGTDGDLYGSEFRTARALTKTEPAIITAAWEGDNLHMGARLTPFGKALADVLKPDASVWWRWGCLRSYSSTAERWPDWSTAKELIAGWADS